MSEEFIEVSLTDGSSPIYIRVGSITFIQPVAMGCKINLISGGCIDSRTPYNETKEKLGWMDLEKYKNQVDEVLGS